METKIIIDSQGQPRTYFKTSCLFCGATVYRIKQKLKPTNFCSRKCLQDAHNHKVSCAICQKPFTIKSSRYEQSKSKTFFCSVDCHSRGQLTSSGLTNIQRKDAGNGQHYYRSLAWNNLVHRCSVCHYDKIPEILEVHHKDCNRRNNQLTNLEFLCPTCHEAFHFTSKTGKYAGGDKRLRSAD